jgi:hypothetical protein
MADLPQADDDIITDGDAPPASPAPRRGPGHRAADARDTAAEMAQRAHEISIEAGSKMAGAMREVIGAAAGFSAFAIESARDLINYMVRRGQMGQEEADVLIQQAEAAYIAKHGALPVPGPKAAPPKPVPLGQLPKAVTAPAAAAEAALEARAAMRIDSQKPSDKVTFAPLEPKAPRVVVAKVETPAVVETTPAAEAKPAASVAPVAPAKAAAPVKAAEKAAEKAPATKEAAKPVAKAPAKAPAKPAAKTPAKPVAKAPAKPAAKAPAKTPAKPAAKAPAKPAAKAPAKPAAKAPAKPAAKAPAKKAAKAPAKKAPAKKK